jgi:hypothetical protein
MSRWLLLLTQLKELSMTDKPKPFIEEAKKRIERKEPAIFHEFDLPLDIFIDQAGGLEMDCACLKVGAIDVAATVRVRLTPQAANTLKRALDALEKTQGEQAEEITFPSSH